jgi:hypothetical protein
MHANAARRFMTQSLHPLLRVYSYGVSIGELEQRTSQQLDGRRGSASSARAAGVVADLVSRCIIKETLGISRVVYDGVVYRQVRSGRDGQNQQHFPKRCGLPATG